MVLIESLVLALAPVAMAIHGHPWCLGSQGACLLWAPAKQPAPLLPSCPQHTLFEPAIGRMVGALSPGLTTLELSHVVLKVRLGLEGWRRRCNLQAAVRCGRLEDPHSSGA